MGVRVIGVDCATDPSKVGLALGHVDNHSFEIFDAFVGSAQRSPVSTVSEWISTSGASCLLALDAPLGWPSQMGPLLGGHRAGKYLDVSGNELFRRATDHFVAERVRITPLDVGADRIARTALSALRLLADVRLQSKLALPLAWSPEIANGAKAIEVYPAATLRAHGLRYRGYKDARQVDERAVIVQGLAGLARLPDDTSSMIQSADALDAAVCLLAARDFLVGNAMTPSGPRFQSLAEKEGWIWVADPNVLGSGAASSCLSPTGSSRR